MAGGRWRRYEHGVLLAGRLGLRSGCRRLWPWGSREFGQRPLRWVCHRGRSNVTPVEPTGIRSGRIPGGLQRPCLAPRTVDSTRATLPAGFSPARGVINVPPPAPVRVCVCGLVSGILWRVCRGMSRGRGGISHGSSRFVIVKFPVISPGSAPHFRLRGPREQATRPTATAGG